MVVAFQSIVALCAFAGLGGLLQYTRRTAVVPSKDAATTPADHIRMGLVLRSHGQVSGPN